MTDRITHNGDLKIYTIDHIDGNGITFQHKNDEDKWIAMKDGLKLRSWR